MANYTVELRNIINSGFDLGMNSYPIFEEGYRKTLNDKILAHYYFREIGQETAGRFKFYLNRTLNEIMPYYNQLYTSTKLLIDPLNTISITEISNRDQLAELEGSGSNEGENNSKAIFSDTPKSLLEVDDIDQNIYASQANIDKSVVKATTINKSTNTANEKNILTKSGYEGVASELLLKYRSTFLNIDMQIIEELETLFMQIY